ncbi:MAG: lytic transglycosylase [Acidiphilium sp. 37-64-53]|nr:lytic transglycosylase domain-containing protein [Pseudomonadota bacterium]OYW01459.1 MAG: lytic transglycosylase [Acidiphilium sp. 37-64-53]OZB30620.1 MAG: lytic transglycosylase [Acidiphilium sp. 34-64-41]
MRGAVKKLSRLSVARACIVSAALLATVAPASAAPAGQRGSTTAKHAGVSQPATEPLGSSGSESVAYAIPRSTPLNGAETMLAQPLTPSDAATYQRIFADQHEGKMAAAQRLLDRVDNPLLKGQVLAQRYLGPYHHATPAELQAWLAAYNGQPHTLRIRALLLQRLPRGASAPTAAVTYLPEPIMAASGAAPPPPPGVPVPRYLADRVANLTRAGHTSLAIDLIGRDNHISTAAGAALRGDVARNLFINARYAEAFTVASQAAHEGGDAVWRPDFIAGLAAWQLHKIAEALPYFTAAASATHTSPGERAAGAFWAARAALRLRHPDAYLHWLDQAAAAPDSFYGMLAGRLLGHGLDGTGLSASLSEADIEAVAAHKDGALAFALIEVGRPADAARALRALWPDIRREAGFGRAVMRVAARAGLVDVAVALDQRLPGNAIAGTSLPLPALHPAGGFNVDPSLIYALARTESGFNVNAVSPVGARGLMQLMPQTAAAMARIGGIGGNMSAPAVNLALGQSYLRYLGKQPGVQRNLLDILASYNAGPVAAAAWAHSIHDGGDPLIFLESIPLAQTRRFVRQVLADSWLYAEQLGTTPESLDAMAEGKFPRLSPYGTALADAGD